MRERRRERSGVPTSATVEAAIEAGSATIAAGAVEPGVAALRSAVRLADAGRERRLRVAVATGAGRGADPLAPRARRGRSGAPARGGPPGPGGRRPGRLGAGPRGARLRRLPAGPLRPGRAVAQRGAEPGRRVTGRDGQGGDLPGFGPQRHRRLPPGDRAARPGRDGSPARRTTRAARRTRCACGAGWTSCEETSTRPTATSATPSPWPSARTGSPSSRGRRPSRGRSASPGRTRRRAAEIFQQAFARACQLGDPCWEGITARGLALVADASGDTDARLRRPCRTRARGARDSRTRTSGSTPTSSTRCASSAASTAIPTPRTWVDPMGELASRSGMRELDRPRPAPLGRAGRCRGPGGGRAPRHPDRQPGAARAGARGRSIDARCRIDLDAFVVGVRGRPPGVAHDRWR